MVVLLWCGVVCHVVLCCVVSCDAVWCVGCVRPKRPRVYLHTGCMGEGVVVSLVIFIEKLVIFEHVEQHLNPMSGSCLIANFLLTKIGPHSYHLLERLTKVTLGSFPFSSLRTGREQHVLDSSNHSPHHFDIQSTARQSHCVSTI